MYFRRFRKHAEIKFTFLISLIESKNHSQNSSFYLRNSCYVCVCVCMTKSNNAGNDEEKENNLFMLVMKF